MPQGKMTGKKNILKMEENIFQFCGREKQNQFIQCFQSTEGKEKM